MRCILRGGHPLLYLPENRFAARETLRLYPAQTRKARLFKRGLDIMLQFGIPLPLSDVSTEELNFGMIRWPENLSPWESGFSEKCMGVLAGNPNVGGRRFLYLFCDLQGRGRLLAKVGIDEEARTKIRVEKDFLESHRGLKGITPLLGEIRHGSYGTGILLPFFRGKHPSLEGTEEDVCAILSQWIERVPAVPLADLQGWKGVASRLSGSKAGTMPVRPVTMHGDFVPWNILIQPGGFWRVIDWERGHNQGIPGWDWFHFAVQHLILVRKAPAREVIRKVSIILQTRAFRDYAERTGITPVVWDLFRGYLVHAGRVIGQSEGRGTLAELVEWAEDQRPENDVREIIMVGQTPPPVHGQSVMNKYLLDGIYRRIRLHHVRLAFSTTIEEVGGFRFRKLMHLTAVLLRIVRLRARHAGAILYFAPAGPRIVPFLRDCLLLIPVRWMFAKTAFHFHASGLSGFRATLPGILRPFFDAAYGRPDLAISISSSGRVDGDSLGARETVVIPNGIPDETKRIPFTQRGKIARPRILFVGMVSAEKGVETLLEACVLLRERGCDFHCDIVGNGPSEMEIHRFRTIIRERGLSGMVTLDGPLHGMNKWKTYASADIFCFPTHYSAESFGLVAVEAMMFGLPVVATHWRGLPDIVADGETGFLVPVKDPALLAERLARLLADPALRARMGEEGRRRYERLFTVKRFREMMEKALSFESPFRLAPVTISVVTPSLDQIEWLRLCIQSVADQVKELSPGGGSRLRVEHIVQDGGSQEIHSFASEVRSLLSESHGAKEAADLQPGEILHMDTPSGYTLRIFSETDGGMYQGINSGLNKAKGSICCWLNCDEQYMEGTLVRVARFFQEMPGMDVLLGDAVLLSEELRPLAYRRIMRPTRWHTRLDHLHTLSCAMFFRRQALPVPALEEKWKVIGDVALMDYFLKSRKKIYACGKLLSAYCFTGENLSATPTEELVTWWRETRWPPRVFKPLTVLHHRVRRLFHGAYRMRHVRGRVWMEGSTQRRRIDGTLSGVWISEKPQA